MRIEYDTTLDDLDAYCEHLTSSPQVRRAFWKRTAVVAVSLAATMFLLPLAYSRNVWVAGIISLVCALPFVLLYPSVLRHETIAVARRQVGSDPAGPALGHHTLEVTADAVTEVCALHTLSIRWPGIRSITGTSNHIFIYLTNHSAIIVPLRSFDTPEAIEQFVDHLKNTAPSTVTIESKNGVSAP